MVSRRRTRLPTERGLTALGGVATVLTLVALLVVAACSSTPSRTPPATSSTSVPTASASATRTPGQVDPFEVVVGDCIDEATGEGELTEVPVVDCATPHLGEAYAVVRMEDRATFPGLDAVAVAAQGCGAPFEEFVGRPLAGSALRVTYLHPTEDSWRAGDREILCVVSDPAGPVTGTLEGASR
ncbi:hypothetical protein GCM10028777_15800 [Angustibacter speluncae]